MDGWMAGKAGLKIAYSNQKSSLVEPFENQTSSTNLSGFGMVVQSPFEKPDRDRPFECKTSLVLECSQYS
jgi:hypothetical protein